MKHEYTFEELAELKRIYDESGEAGLGITEMRALRKAGLLTQGLPAKPSKRELILAHCKNRISQGQPFDGKETAEALGLSLKTVGNILSQLRKEGLLPAYDKHSPRSKAQKTTTSGKKKETMTTTQKLTATNITESKITANDVTTGTIDVRPQATADPRAIISNALTGIFDAISALQKTAFQTNDKVIYGFATKTPQRRTHGLESQLLEGRGEMRLKFDSESGVFTIEPESLAETVKLRTSALDIAHLLVNYFDADIIKADINKPSNQQGA
ncbi:MAG: molecular chaperone GrpE [Bifidobacterium catenulatum]